MDAGEKSSDTMAVELKISCQAPEVVLFTEEAILRRLQELMDNSSNSITVDIGKLYPANIAKKKSIYVVIH